MAPCETGKMTQMFNIRKAGSSLYTFEHQSSDGDTVCVQAEGSLGKCDPSVAAFEMTEAASGQVFLHFEFHSLCILFLRASMSECRDIYVVQYMLQAFWECIRGLYIMESDSYSFFRLRRIAG
jgi:hypothetical protein